MSVYEVWAEGYRVMEGAGYARKLGEVEAPSFRVACKMVCGDPDWQARNGDFDPERLTVWGCRLFPDQASARRAFG